MNKFFCGTFLLLLSLNSCQTSTDVSPDIHPIELSYLNQQFTVVMPRDWSAIEDLNDVALLEAGNEADGGYLIVIVDEKAIPDDLTLETHSQATRVHLRGGNSNYIESDPSFFTIGPYRALRYQLNRTIEDTVYTYWHVTIETEKHYHQFLFWNLESKLWRNEPDFSAILDSFKAID